jgi:hypothetical protein
MADSTARGFRGSRAGCLKLTEGPDDTVAARLSRLFAPNAEIDPSRHVWQPRGFDAPDEARLDRSPRFLGAAQRKLLTDWWLAVPRGANTPNWDIASTATIDGREGLVLVEAKAHANEIKIDDRSTSSNPRNRGRIIAAIGQANVGLNNAMPGWAMSVDRCYQLCNRFAWSWKVATLGTPVLLVYLGFLNDDDMQKEGEPFADHESWERRLHEHTRGVIPPAAWEKAIDVEGTRLRAVIRSIELEPQTAPSPSRTP